MVSLREWETARPDEGSLLAQQSLAGFPAGRRLAEELSKTGRIEVLELARGRARAARSAPTTLPGISGRWRCRRSPPA
jgi:hypothetical protein